MPEELPSQKLQLAVKEGFERMKSYRRATAMFVKEYVGAYYARQYGLKGEMPINLMYNAVRAIVPNIVMKSPVNKVTTPYVAHRPYAELLSLGLDSVDEQIGLKETLRAWVVSALFGWGIIKVGLSASGQMIEFGDVNVDPGQVYAKLVSLDNWVIDPMCTDLREASFLGNRTMVPRQLLLDTDIYDHDLVMRLPMSSAVEKNDKDRLSDLTKLQSGAMAINGIQDLVDVVELWIPGADAIVTIPDPYQTTFEKYISIEDYYGPKEGPYVDLSFSQPVEGNPFPVAPASVWYDLHNITNVVFNKVIEQTLAQKDIVLYNPANSDEMGDIRDAKTNEYIASTDPKSFQQISLGGQNVKNEVMLQELQTWFNYMAANPDQMAGNTTPGTSGGKQSATKSAILQNNAAVGVEDMRGMTYDGAARVNKKLGWYLHTDPLIDLPLTKRKTGGEYVQLQLTPEQRQGDFINFAFNIKQRSMSKLPPQERTRRIFEFCSNVLPAAVNSAQIMMQMGRPFNLEAYLTLMAHEAGIEDEVEDLFYDPQFQQRLSIMMQLGPQNAGKAGGGGGTLSTGAIMQNGGLPSATKMETPGQQFNSNAQIGANPGQADIRG